MKKKILIIEDEHTLVQALLDNFKDDNYEIVTAFDGALGWEKIKIFKPDLILLDLIIPKIDGFTLLTKIKANNKFKNIPVIVLTNLSDAIEKCAEMGAVVCLIKSNESMDNIKRNVKKILE